jgi:Flp pilus assembly protein TadG
MSFMRNLLRDKSANTLAISAAAMVPLMAMVGGGIDASRYYMASARMQAACDAGALAARRAMTDDTFNTAHRTIGLNFFDQNFNDGLYGVSGRTRDFITDGEGVVFGNASATLPTTIMGAFGYDSFNITVSCSAEVNISNTDIMFVLDVTGSMNCAPENLTGGNCGNDPDPGSKIEGLQNATMQFYDVVASSTSESAQVRYGIVPYSHNVNVGALLDDRFMASSHTYQSRVPRFREDITVIPGNGVEVGDEIVVSDQTEWLPRATVNFGSSNTDHYRFRNSGSSARATAENFCWNTLPGTYNVTISGQQQTWQVFAPTQYVTNQWSDGNTNNRAGCRGRVRKTRIATQDDVIEEQTIRNIVFNGYVYCQVDTSDPTPCNVTNPVGSPPGWETVNLSTLYDDNRIDLPTGTNGAMQTHVWNGCVEVATTVRAASYNPVPAGATDADINLVPSTESERWKPSLPNAVWRRTLNGNNTRNDVITSSEMARALADTCPPAARNLDEITRAELQTYVNGLVAFGATYHSAGLLWGGRLISPRGIFASRNETAPNGDAISRHVIFMTDGLDNETNPFVYSPFGLEWWDLRVTTDGSTAQSHARHAERLAAVCRAVKNENITLWVVSFRNTLPQNLVDCASPGRAFMASSNAELAARFREIAQRIAALRLTS